MSAPVVNWLHDQALDATYMPPRKVTMPGTDPTRAAALLRSYRSRIREARRMALDNQFLAIALEASRELERVQHWINIARLPFPRTWIEWDSHEKVRLGAAAGTLAEAFDGLDDVPARCGMLLEELDADGGAWMATTFTAHGGVTLSHVWLLSPEGPSLHAVRAPKGLRLAHEAVQGIPAELSAVGIGLSTKSGRGQVVVAPPWIDNRLGVALEPLWELSLKGAPKSDVPRRLVISNLMEESGIIRFVITVLAMLNAAPNVRHLQAPRLGHRFQGMNKVPYLHNELLSVSLPKKKPMVTLYGMLNKAAKDRRHNRAHEVRGHYRQIERGKGTIVACRHEPTMVEDGVGICLRCERLIRWIPAHNRGDAALGWVHHDYLLTK